MYLTIPWKQEYIFGKKPEGCVLCGIYRGDVESHVIYRDDMCFIVLNKFPYNPGHLMIVPARHVTEISELSDDETKLLANLTKKAVDVLKREYNPVGFNIGMNVGEFSGASISHIHIHVVPRYRNEMGFMDVVAGTRILVEDLPVTYERLIKYRDEFETIRSSKTA